MGTTSDKLSYLATTKDKLKTAINYTGANITTDTFRSYPRKLYDAYLDILNNGISNLISNIPKVQGEGTYLKLTNTAEAPLIDFSLYGETQQDSTTGKNLLPTNSFTLTKGTNRTLNIDFASPIPAGTYTLSCKITSQSGLSTTVGLAFQLYDSGGSLVGFNTITSDTTSPYSSTKTIPSQATKLYCYLSNSLDDSATITIDELMLESGSTATSFEPYTNGASPNPDYPQPIHNVSGDNTIEICGKNLLPDNANQWESGHYATDGTKQPNSSRMRLVNLLQVKSSTQYYMTNALSDIQYTIREYDKNGQFIYNAGGISSGGTFTTQSNTKYLGVSLLIAYSNYDKDTAKLFMCYNNLTDKSYESYKGNSQLISLGDIELNKISTYQDYIYKENDRWYFHKGVRHLSLAISDMNNSENYPGWTGLSQLKQDYPNVNDSAFNVGMKYYTNICKQVSEANDYIGINTTSTNETLTLRRAKFGNDYTQPYWQTNYPNLIIELYYGLPIEKQTDTEITDTTLLEQLNNLMSNAKSYNHITHVSQDNNDLASYLKIVAIKEYE